MHRHRWKLVEKVEQPSAFDVMRQDAKSMSGLYPDYFVRPVIVTYRCDKCGTEQVERV